MSRVRKRLEQYKQQLERQTQYKAGLPGSALDIVNTLLSDLDADEESISKKKLTYENSYKFANDDYRDGWNDCIDEITGGNVND
jgi:hypothetical protein